MRSAGLPESQKMAEQWCVRLRTVFKILQNTLPTDRKMTENGLRSLSFFLTSTAFVNTNTNYSIFSVAGFAFVAEADSRMPSLSL